MELALIVCTVCGGRMEPTRQVPGKGVRLKRYKCTCGHIEDRADTGRPEPEPVGALPEGIEEIFDENLESAS